MGDELDGRKRELRELLRARRRALDPAVARHEAGATAEVVRTIVEHLAPPALASYEATANELAVDALHAWWWAAGGVVLLPRVRAPGELTWHAVRSAAELVPGAYGLREPRAEAPRAELIAGTAVVVPGVGFAGDGRRLGQGGGYYDRVLAAPGLHAIGVGYACQRCDEVPVAPHDRPVAWLVLGGALVLRPSARSA